VNINHCKTVKNVDVDNVKGTVICSDTIH